MFVFKFEKILKIKEDLIKKYMLEIANIEAIIREKIEYRKNLEYENSIRKRKIDEILKKEPDRETLLFIQENIDRVYDEIKYVNGVVDKLKEEKAKILEIVKSLNIEKKKLEKLKEKEYEHYTKEEAKKEMRFLDEIASIKAANNRANN